jgi:glutathione-regulated potassium-efflux system ancillary protein KefG
MAERKRVELADLIDSQDVADILGLAQSRNVSLYQSRYPDMPRPLIDRGPGRPMLWSRREIERWAEKRTDKRKR